MENDQTKQKDVQGQKRVREEEILSSSSLSSPLHIEDDEKRKKQKESLEKKVHIGVINPKGEVNGQVTTYFTQEELLKLCDELPGKPVHLSHIIKHKGEKVRPSGEILHAEVDSETGKLRASFLLYDDDPLGEIAKKLVGESDGVEEGMRTYELSMGYEMDAVTEDGLTTTKNKRVTEVSLCWKGAREGTVLEKSVPLTRYFTKFPTPHPNLREVNAKFQFHSPHIPHTHTHTHTDAYKNIDTKQQRIQQTKKPTILHRPQQQHIQPRDLKTGRFQEAGRVNVYDILIYTKNTSYIYTY
jgi:hypothetical protein